MPLDRLMAFRIALVALVASVSLHGLAHMPPQDMATVDSYRAALEAARRLRDPGTLETALDRLDAVRQAFLRVHDNGATVLETLAEADFARLEHDLPGVLLSRDEVAFVKPDPDYFLARAAEHGDDADRRFFAAYKQTYPGGVWPLYVRQQTDYRGCTAFGGGRLVAAYRLWGCGSSGAAARVSRNSELQDLGTPSDACVRRHMAPTRS